jgi:CDP-diglyceride synthetase
MLPSQNPTGVIYGMIVIGALLAAESGLHETYPEAVGSMVIAACTYWLADAYAAVLGRRLATNAPLTPRGLSRALVSNWAVVRGAAIPVLVILVCWVLGARQPAAVNAALWSVVASLVGFELLAGIRSRASPGELAVEVAIGVAMGIGVLALKILLHH